MTQMVNIVKGLMDGGNKKKPWVKPEIRTLAHDDPLVKHFKSLTAEKHDNLFPTGK